MGLNTVCTHLGTLQEEMEGIETLISKQRLLPNCYFKNIFPFFKSFFLFDMKGIHVLLKKHRKAQERVTHNPPYRANRCIFS